MTTMELSSATAMTVLSSDRSRFLRVVWWRALVRGSKWPHPMPNAMTVDADGETPTSRRLQSTKLSSLVQSKSLTKRQDGTTSSSDPASLKRRTRCRALRVPKLTRSSMLARRGTPPRGHPLITHCSGGAVPRSGSAEATTLRANISSVAWGSLLDACTLMYTRPTSRGRGIPRSVAAVPSKTSHLGNV